MSTVAPVVPTPTIVLAARSSKLETVLHLLLTVLVSVVMSGATSIAMHGAAPVPTPAPTPAPTPLPIPPPLPLPVVPDSALVAIGKAQAAAMGPAYAEAWEDGAKLLDAGQPLSMALKQVGTSWSAGRLALFDASIQPALHKIVPEATKDADFTPAQRVALSAAWKSLAKGLR